MQDYEILLLSWTQLTALQLIMGEEKEAAGSLRVLEEKLADEYDVDNISLIGRTYEEYAVAFTLNGENQIVRFEADEVESIYDL